MVKLFTVISLEKNIEPSLGSQYMHKNTHLTLIKYLMFVHIRTEGVILNVAI